VSLRGLEGIWNGKMILELKIAPKTNEATIKNPLFNGCFEPNQKWGLFLSSKQPLWEKRAKLQWFSELSNM
jgi:hypothetical protein